MTAKLTFYDDPAVFLEDVSPLLQADPIGTTVLGSVTTRTAANRASGVVSDQPEWWVIVREDDVITSAAMRAEGGRAVGMFVVAMSRDGARELASALLARGEIPPGVNGALPAGRFVAYTLAAATGATVVVKERTRLHVLEEVAAPEGVPGSLRRAVDGDLPVLQDWLEVFELEAGAQAGRTAERITVEKERILRRIEDGSYWVWDVEGEPVHLTGHNPSVHGVVRIGPVYTPPEHRRRGYARAAVAAVSQALVDLGNQVCLYTDVDNPTSNRAYADIGFAPVVDQANLALVESRRTGRRPPKSRPEAR